MIARECCEESESSGKAQNQIKDDTDPNASREALISKELDDLNDKFLQESNDWHLEVLGSEILFSRQKIAKLSFLEE